MHTTITPTSRVLWFEDPAAADPRQVGGKAAALAGLASRHPVPPGFVVTDGAPAAAVVAAYDQLAARVGSADPVVAVRSSATDEDGLEASFAGQHETVLGVQGPDEVLEALEACRASGRSPRALAYRRANGLRAPAADCPSSCRCSCPPTPRPSSSASTPSPRRRARCSSTPPSGSARASSAAR